MTREDIIRMAREAGPDPIYSACDIPDMRYVYEDLLDHLGTQIAERLEAEVLMEREACADICDQHASVEGIAQRCAEQIRARSKT